MSALPAWVAICASLQIAILAVSFGYALQSFRLLRLSILSAATWGFGILVSSIWIHVLLLIRSTNESVTWHAWLAFPATLLGAISCYLWTRAIYSGIRELDCASGRREKLREIQDLTRRIFR